MQYMLLIYDDEVTRASMSDAERSAFMGAYFQLSTDLREAGAFIAGDGLQGVATATSVRVRDGQRLVTDGPFAETKERLGGYYLIEADSLDEALAWAAKIPTAESGTIEVRPVAVYS